MQYLHQHCDAVQVELVALRRGGGLKRVIDTLILLLVLIIITVIIYNNNNLETGHGCPRLGDPP
jgi:hypothetical protein